MTQVAAHPGGGREGAAAGAPDWARVSADAIDVHGAVQKPGELAALLELLAEVAPRVIIEVGADRGGTLYAWSQLPGPPRVLAVDLPNAWGSSHTGLPETHGADLVLGDSHTLHTLRRVRAWLAGHGGLADMVFIDADHNYAPVAADFRLYQPLVREGGLVVFHDILIHPVFATGVNQLWEEIKPLWPTTDIITEPLSWGGIGVLTNRRRPPPEPLRIPRPGPS